MKALSISQLHKQYKGGTSALKGISFEVETGDFFALLGPNGAGKSTTIGIISNLVNKTSGEVVVFGKNLDEFPDEVKSNIGLVPQEFNFSVFEKVQDIVVNQSGYYGIPRAEAKQKSQELLSKLGLWQKRDMASRTLSGGMKRKLMIVRALLHNPKLLILDEPTAGVDVETRREMWNFLTELNKQGTTIILTTHYLEEAEQLCKNIAIIDHGEIIQNTSMKNLLSQLDSETFILDLKAPVKDFRPIIEYNVEQMDDSTLKAEITKRQSLNQLFAQLSQQNIEVCSLRNKQNRLEELFIRLTQKHDS